jgi:alpha,alpha-trehalose phosphorylase
MRLTPSCANARSRRAISHRQVTYTLLDGPPVTLHHLDEQCRLSLGQPLTRPLAQLVKRSEAPHQPPGRKPRHQG